MVEREQIVNVVMSHCTACGHPWFVHAEIFLHPCEESGCRCPMLVVKEKP